MKFFFCLFILLIPKVYASMDIAKTYAPVIYQGLGAVPDADQFTRIDFDQDWDPDNNWDNMDKFPRPPVVYWNVIESEKHYFITYAFFYPRDYAALCFWVHCHENDFEGMRVTVAKPGTIVKIEGLAHNFKTEIHNPKSVEVTIEKEGHGVHPYSLRSPDKEHKIYRPHEYELRPLAEIWERRDSLFRGEFTYKGKTYPAKFGGKKWIIFGIGSAKPPWSWEIWRSDIEKGEWFLDPLKGSEEKYLLPF